MLIDQPAKPVRHPHQQFFRGDRRRRRLLFADAATLDQGVTMTGLRRRLVLAVERQGDSGAHGHPEAEIVEIADRRDHDALVDALSVFGATGRLSIPLPCERDAFRALSCFVDRVMFAIALFGSIFESDHRKGRLVQQTRHLQAWLGTLEQLASVGEYEDLGAAQQVSDEAKAQTVLRTELRHLSAPKKIADRLGGVVQRLHHDITSNAARNRAKAMSRCSRQCSFSRSVGSAISAKIRAQCTAYAAAASTGLKRITGGVGESDITQPRTCCE